jgi:DNA-binding MarR family transcriptional regulator
VPNRLQDELKQSRPFGSPHEELWLNIARTSAVLDHAGAQFLKPFGITPTQYNVLRILRGAGELGLCRNEVGERLIRAVPDVTRLLDRMEEMGLITRRRGEDDRRFVTAVITAQGLALLADLDAPIIEFHRVRLGHLSDDQLRAAIEVMERIRAAV